MSAEPIEWTGVFASAVAATVSAVGVFMAMSFGEAARRYGALVSAFAVGFLLAGILLHLAPEAAAHSRFAAAWIAVGFAMMVLIGIGVQTAVSPRADGAALAFGYASIIGLAVHSAIDGAIYAAAFHESAVSGWLSTGGLLLHEFPEGVIAFSLLQSAGLSRWRALALALAAASLTTLAGALIANALMATGAGEPPTGPLLGAAAGALGYVLIVHLAPHASKAPRGYGYFVAQLGVAIATAAVIIESLGGGHAH